MTSKVDKATSTEEQPPTRLEQAQQFGLDALTELRTRLKPGVRRQLWRLLTLASLLLVGVGSFYAWREISAGSLQIDGRFLSLALGIVVINYGLHLLGWHLLVNRLCGHFRLHENAEALALSSLVKYLPTIAWYIANRADYYNQRGVAVQPVVAASLLELIYMISSGGLLFVVFWLGSQNLLLLALVVLALGLLLFRLTTPETVLWRWWQRRITPHTPPSGAHLTTRYTWLIAPLLYGVTWLTGVVFLWATIHTFTPVTMATTDELLLLTIIWLLTGVASFLVSLTLGTIGILREITLGILLAQYWALPVAVAVPLLVKLLLTLGDIACSLLILGGFYLFRKRHKSA